MGRLGSGSSFALLAVAFSAWTGRLAAQGWEEAARQICRKIAPMAGRGEAISIQVRALAAHPPSLAGAITTACGNEGLRLSAQGVSVLVTVSETPGRMLLVAELARGEDRQVVFSSVGRTSTRLRTAVNLEREFLFELEEPILDVTAAEDDLLALMPTMVMLLERRDGAWEPAKTAITGIARPVRDPRGRLLVQERAFTAQPPGALCLGRLSPLTMSCRPADSAREERPTRFEGWGSDSAVLETACGSYVLGTRDGDDSQPDEVRVFELRDGKPAPAGDGLSFAGPVTMLRAAADGSAFAVARELTTGRYAAYRLRISCSR